MNTTPHNPDAHNEQFFDAQLQAALEYKPAVRIRPDFADRMAAQAATQPLRKARRVVSYGQTAAVLSAALLLLLMFALVPWTQASFSSIAFDVELLAAAQLIAITWWLTGRRRA